MRRSQLFAPTLREDPAEAEIASHRLLLRAGFIRQLAAGIYTSLPLGLRAMRKIEAIVREEMDGSGAQEIRMPIVLPAEPWRRTGRDELAMARSYETMFQAYRRIFDRCGMDYVIVDAEPGQIGGGVNHEFMARAEVGEDLFVECEHGDYLADLKAARPQPPDPVEPGTQPLTVLDTPDTPTIESLCALVGCEPPQTLKCIMFDVGGRTTAVLVP